MTAKYSAAKHLAAKGGSITIKGSTRLDIPDQIISGAAIVDRMEATPIILNAGPSNSDTPTQIFNGGVPPTRDGSPSPGPMTFYRNGDGVDIGTMFGHEILHTIYSGAGVPNLGWANPAYNPEHRVPFDEASNDLL